jgi:hypothetical protein
VPETEKPCTDSSGNAQTIGNYIIAECQTRPGEQHYRQGKFRSGEPAASGFFLGILHQLTGAEFRLLNSLKGYRTFRAWSRRVRTENIQRLLIHFRSFLVSIK